MNTQQILAKARACDLMVEAFILMLIDEPSDRDHQEVTDRLCDLAPEERRVLKVALNRLDEKLDALALDRHLRRDE